MSRSGGESHTMNALMNVLGVCIVSGVMISGVIDLAVVFGTLAVAATMTHCIFGFKHTDKASMTHMPAEVQHLILLAIADEPHCLLDYALTCSEWGKRFSADIDTTIVKHLRLQSQNVALTKATLRVLYAHAQQPDRYSDVYGAAPHDDVILEEVFPQEDPVGKTVMVMVSVYLCRCNANGKSCHEDENVPGIITHTDEVPLCGVCPPRGPRANPHRGRRASPTDPIQAPPTSPGVCPPNPQAPCYACASQCFTQEPRANPICDLNLRSF